MPVLEIAGQAIHFELGGAERGPVVVLIHSLGTSLRMWDKAAARLGGECRLLAVDLRGHGESGVSAASFLIDDLGHDVLSVLDHLGIAAAFFCGISLGGLVSVWLGAKHPAQVRGLVLANTAARIGSGESWDERIALVRQSGMGALARELPERWFTERYRMEHPQEMDQVRAMVEATPADGYIDCCRVLRDTDLRPELASIRAPSLAIAGAHDAATPPAQQRELANRLADARYLELNASHLSAWECAEEFSAAVRGSLQEQGAFHG